MDPPPHQSICEAMIEDVPRARRQGEGHHARDCSKEGLSIIQTPLPAARGRGFFLVRHVRRPKPESQHGLPSPSAHTEVIY